MRLKTVLLPVNNTPININYNYYLSSLLYRIIESSNSEYSKQLHEEGYVLGSRKFKLFTFSNLRPEKFRVDKEAFYMEGKTELFISSPKTEFILHLGQGLLSAKKVSIVDAEFTIEKVELLPQPEFKKEMKFKCLSPIATYTAEVEGNIIKQIPCEVGSYKFIENLKNNLIKKYYVIHKTIPQDLNLEIIYDDSNLSKYKKGKLIRFKQAYIKGYTAPFTMRGSVDLIKTAYDAGLGEKTSAGCGMIEVL